MNNENETNLISGVVNATDDEQPGVDNVSDESANRTAVVIADEQINVAVEASETDAEAAETKTADTLHNEGDNSNLNSEPLSVSDIVEQIIDRVVERMTAGTATSEKMSDETVARRSTPNFLSDIRPDFWDR